MVFLVSPVKSIFLETKAINKMTDPAAQFDHRNRRAYLKCFIDRFIKLDSELADPGRFPKGRNLILIIDNSMSLTFPPMIHQTAEMATDSGSLLESTECTESFSVPRMIPVPGSRRNYRLMFW